VRRAGPMALVSIADHGPGIPREAIERMLRPFERGEAARSGTRGAGLGLAIVDRIARLHGGTLRVLANEPKGVRVELRLPATPA